MRNHRGQSCSELTYGSSSCGLWRELKGGPSPRGGKSELRPFISVVSAFWLQVTVICGELGRAERSLSPAAAQPAPLRSLGRRGHTGTCGSPCWESSLHRFGPCTGCRCISWAGRERHGGVWRVPAPRRNSRGAGVQPVAERWPGAVRILVPAMARKQQQQPPNGSWSSGRLGKGW